MKSILVTGAAGFIGARTIELLLKKKAVQVVGLDNLNDYYDPRLKKFRLNSFRRHPNFTFFKTTVENKKSLNRIFQEHDFGAVINLAARAGVRSSVENPHIYASTNIGGSLNLLEMCRKFGVQKYVVASTSSLYAGQKMPFKESLSVNRPISPYAATKKAAEVMAYTYHHLYGLDVSVLRYFTVYGPGGRPDMSPFRFIDWIQNEKPLSLYGDGSQERDFTFVDDIAEGTIEALKSVGYSIFNLGNNKPYSIREMITLIEEGVGKKAKIKKYPFPKTDMTHTWADIRKAQKILKWKPQTSFQEGLQKTIQWHQEHQSFIQSLDK